MNLNTPQTFGRKVMVIPALREADDLDLLDACITDEGPTETVFLGNYFADVANDSESARLMAKWLKRSVSQPRRIHLMGGGDLAYLCQDGCSVRGVGGTNERVQAVREVLGPMAHMHFYLTWWEGAWLFSHAGLSAAQLPSGLVAPQGVRRYLETELRTAMHARQDGRAHWFWGDAGEGESRGLLGCDRRSFLPVQGINQVFADGRGVGERVVAPDSINYAFDANGQTGGWSSYLLMYPESGALRRVELNEIESLSNEP